MRSIEMERAAADNHSAAFQHHKVSHVLTDLGQGSRQKSSVASVGGYQRMDALSIGQDGFTRAHGRPPEWTRSSVEREPSPALLAPELCRREHRGPQAPTPTSGKRRNRYRISGSPSAVPPETNLEARIAFPDTSVRLFRSAHAPDETGLRVVPSK